MAHKDPLKRAEYHKNYYVAHPERFNIRCIHGVKKTRCRLCGGSFCEHNILRSECRICSPRNFCEHNRRKYACADCGGGSMCEHKKQRSNCKICGRNAVCKHGWVSRTCRECFPRAWAVRILSRTAKDARRGNYAAIKASPEEVLSLLGKSPLCCGCDQPLNYTIRGFRAPCIHHNHETGELIGFAHRECNMLEGQLQKLGERLPNFIKNFFPRLMEKTEEK